MMMMSPMCAALNGKKYSDASLIGDFTSLEANLADLQDSEDNRTTPSSRADSNDEDKVGHSDYYRRFLTAGHTKCCRTPLISLDEDTPSGF